MVMKPKYVAGFREMKEIKPSKICQNYLKQDFYFLPIHGIKKQSAPFIYFKDPMGSKIRRAKGAGAESE